MILRALEPAARAGRLRVPAEQAAREILAASTGVVLTLITSGETIRGSPTTSATRCWRGSSSRRGPLAEAAAALDAALGESPLSATETALLREWLDRLSP